MDEILVRPVIERDHGFDYSTLSELQESDFRKLFSAYIQITDVVVNASEMKLMDFLRAIMAEADVRGYFEETATE